MSSIAEHGLANTTVARVAEAAGLSQGIMNFYFESKQALLDAIIEATFDPAVCNPRYLDVWDAF
jgi:TetR/AcrR family transcriptional repressor of bet genes